VVRLLFADEHNHPTAAQAKEVLRNGLVDEAQDFACVELLLQLHKLDGSGAAVLADIEQELQDMEVDLTDVRMVMLEGWVAETAAAEGDHAALAVREQETAALMPQLGEMLVAFALQHWQQQQQQQQQSTGAEAAQSVAYGAAGGPS
jgi:hypothetical protein